MFINDRNNYKSKSYIDDFVTYHQLNQQMTINA